MEYGLQVVLGHIACDDECHERTTAVNVPDISAMEGARDGLWTGLMGQCAEPGLRFAPLGAGGVPWRCFWQGGAEPGLANFL